ncbi:MAG: hypothetical protein AB8B61_00440 [Cyclobacteriaceae bacterium]
MNKLVFLFLSFSFCGFAQQFTLKKGSVIDEVTVNDSINESFSLYLPTDFDMTKEWPVVLVFDMQGRGKQVVSMFREAAEQEGYILAASNNVQDTLALSKNVLISSRMLNQVYAILPIKRTRIYTGGFAAGARMASILPTFIKEIKGVISCGSALANGEVLSSKRPFHFIGIVGREDYNYRTMLSSRKLLDNLKFPNQLLVFEGGVEWPKPAYLKKAMRIFTLAAMSKGEEPRDEQLIAASYLESLGDASAYVTANKPLMAQELLMETMRVYRSFRDIDSLKSSLKTLRKTKLFKNYTRSQNAAFFKENLIKDDYVYYLEEDVLSYNYNNLGWWKFQMEELTKYEKTKNIFEREMAARLKSFLNALIADNIDAVNAASIVDQEALIFLWMVNTVTDPKNPKPYLKVISKSSRFEDFGTALFYLEELLKTGFTDKKSIYELENTALFRITPQFNALIKRYFKDVP